MGTDPEILAKKAASNLKKFGSHPMHNAACRTKLRETFIEKYGVDNPRKSEEVKKKLRATWTAKYGVDNPSKNQEVIEAIRTDALARYVTSKDEIIGKRRATYLKQTGFTCNKHYHISKESIIRMKDLVWLSDQHFVLKKSIAQIAKELGVSPTPILLLLTRSNIDVIRHGGDSAEQRELHEFISSIIDDSTAIQSNNRHIIAPKEIDIFLPEQKLAIELDGIYWHSEEKGKHSLYHLNKTRQCESLGIKMIHIYDAEWNDQNKQKIIKSRISHLLGKSKKIFARKCVIKEISSEDCRNFLTANHIQGNCPAKIKLGLYNDNILCAVGTFGGSRYDKKYEWELLRYTAIIGVTIVGGASKILKHFISNYNTTSIISYADRRWSEASGTVYSEIGFTQIGSSLPNYKYFKINKGQAILSSRNQFQKHMLGKKLELFDPDLTEYENMSMNGYHKIWDCGKLIYAWRK